MRVAADLRQRILNGEFAPGQRLKIDDIATLFGVSHMPVRAALQELESEGVLQVFPHRGAEIRGVDVRCLLYTSPSPRDKRQSRMPSSA